MRIRAFLLATGVTGASVAAGLAFTGVASAQSPNAGANPNASPCAPGGPGYPPGQRGTTVGPGNSFRRGDNGNVQGCASPNSRFSATMHSHPKPLGTGTADATGFFSLGFTVPCDAEDGGHTIVVQGTGVVDGAVNVTVNGTNPAVCGRAAGVRDLDERGRQTGAARRAGGGGGALPRTGSASSAPLAAAGVGLVLIGGVAVYFARRRRTLSSVEGPGL